jgi:hypothetical protein
MQDNLDPFRPSGWWDLAGPARGFREALSFALDPILPDDVSELPLWEQGVAVPKSTVRE